MPHLVAVLAIATTVCCSAGVLNACTTILAGKTATHDGSVLMATSCDGSIMGRTYVVAARTYAKGHQTSMYFDFPAASTWKAQESLAQKGYTLVGELPIEQTYHCVFVAGHLADSITGGINEHGLSMGIEYMGMKPELVNRRGIVSTCSNHWTTSLIANGLLRTKSAREAIRLMGAMVQQHGFTYYWAPAAGCAIPIVDRQEAWIMEIFGPGADWTPGCGKPGAVWCARRVPDGEITCNANRSRIGHIDLSDSDYYMASPNVHSLGEQLGLWKPGQRFLWHDVYGVPGGRENSLREWAALNRLAPSLGLTATGNPNEDRFPFSVRPDHPVDVPRLVAVMRDSYQGTTFDVTAEPGFNPGGKRSPLANPFGSQELFELASVQPERCIGSETSSYVYVSQIRHWLPAPVAGCMWLTLGPSYTSCFAPVYCGVTDLPDSWSRLPDFTKIDKTQVQWKFQLVEDLAGLRFQEAMQDVRHVTDTTEQAFYTKQPAFEKTAVATYEKQGSTAAARLVTQYTNSCLDNVDSLYGELVDHLMFNYLYSYPGVAPPTMHDRKRINRGGR